MKICRSALLRGALAGAVAVGLGVSGCSKNHEPRAGGTPTGKKSASAKPTPSKTPTPSRTPTPTKAPTGSIEQQLHAATVNFYDVINEAYRTLDTRPVDDVLVPGSNAASGYTAYIERVKAKGGHFEDLGGYKVSDFKLVANGGNSPSKRVEFTLSNAGAKEVGKTGEVVKTFNSESRRNSWIYFERRDGRWLVVSQHIGESPN